MTDRFRFHCLKLDGTPAAIGAASAWLRSLGSRHGLSDEDLFHLDLCASELVTNVVDYAYGGKAGEIRLELLLDQATATLTVIDAGPPFDPLSQPAPPQPGSLQEAPDGGLGLHLVRQLASVVHYERGDGRNRVTVRIGDEQPRPDRPGGSPAAAHDPPTHWDKLGERDRLALDSICGAGLFRGASRGDVDAIVAHCELRDCSAGEVLLRAGERRRCVLLPLVGRLEVHLDDPQSSFHIDVAAGECVGELSVIDGSAISAWVVAGEAGRLLVIPEAVFLGPLLAVPAIARNLLAMLSERMRRGNDQIVARVRAALELESLQRELDLARQIQSSMLPAAPIFPHGAGIECRGFMRAARQVGGDFYDAFPVGDQRFFVAVGDVCSKGTPAALFMVRTLTLLRSEALRPETDAELQLARLAARCNDLLSQTNEAQQFVTLFCAIIDVRAGCIHHVNAGHNRPLLLLPDTPPMFLAGPRNPIAGMVPGLKYSAGRDEFPPGSLLLMYTDGITEADAGGGNLFGDDALLALMEGGGAASSVDACIERVIAAVDAFAAAEPQSDDITLLAVRRP